MLMSVRLTTALAWVLLVVLAALGVWGYVEAVQADPAVVGSVGAAVLGVFGVLWQQRASERSRLREVHRERMSPIYDGLLELVMKAAARAGESERGTEGEGDEPDQETEVFMRDLKGRQLLLRAPREMIQAFTLWQAQISAAKDAQGGVAAVLAWEAFLLAVRKDLGHDDTGLPPGELLRVLIPDIDSHLAPTQAGPGAPVRDSA